MRLVLQCTLCGTINTVGSNSCGSCRASGLQNLRLMFECLRCFKLGLNPACESCMRLLPENSEIGENIAADLAERWGVSDIALEPSLGATEIIIAEELLEAKPGDDGVLELPRLEDDRGKPEIDDSRFELSKDEILLGELDDDILSLDDDDDPVTEGDATRGERADG